MEFFAEIVNNLVNNILVNNFEFRHGLRGQCDLNSLYVISAFTVTHIYLLEHKKNSFLPIQEIPFSVLRYYLPK